MTTRDQPVPGPFPGPTHFLREKPWGRGCLAWYKERPKKMFYKEELNKETNTASLAISKYHLR